jgi:putative ABC transport system permease protein
VFTLVAIATVGGTVQASLDNTVAEQSGGYTFFGVSSSPIPNLPGQVASNASLDSQFRYVVPLYMGGVEVNVSGFSANPYDDTLYSAPSAQNATSNFYLTNQFPLTSTWRGMSSGEVMNDLETNATVAVVDQSYAPATANIEGTSSSAAHPTVAVGELIHVTNPATGAETSVTVIGILAEDVISGVWINPAMALSLGFSHENAFFLTTAPGASATHAAQLAKTAFFRYGLVLYDIPALLATSIAQTEGVIGLLQIFVGLGLAVGIAAMGIVAVRAVVERRREIGMIRANGFTRRMVLKAFFLEYSFVALLGIGIGTGLGILIVYNLTIGPSAAASDATTFSIPWANLLLILGVAYGLAMAAVAEPSLRAARLPPAEAVRPTE